MMETVNHRTAWIVLILVALVALGLVVWATTGFSYPVATDTTVQTGTSQGGQQGGTNTAGGTGSTGTGSTGSMGTGSTGTGTTQNRNVTIAITGFNAGNPTVMPVMSYTLTGNVEGDMISIVGKTGGEVVYINEQPASAGTSYSLNLADLTRGDGSKTAVAPGEYFLRISEKSGKVLNQSGFFMVRAGKGEVQ